MARAPTSSRQPRAAVTPRRKGDRSKPRLRHEKGAKGSEAALHKLLLELTAKTPEVLAEAEESIGHLCRQYRKSALVPDADAPSHYRLPTKGAATKGLLELRQNIQSLRKTLDTVDFAAIDRFCRSYGPVGRLKSALASAEIAVDLMEHDAVVRVCCADGPMGLLNSALSDAEKAVELAEKAASVEPDNPPDHARVYLAYGLGVILQSFGIPLTLSESDDRISGARKGAAWARTVNLSLAVAGYPNVKVFRRHLKLAKGLIAELG